jgi:hypothetical protein
MPGPTAEQVEICRAFGKPAPPEDCEVEHTKFGDVVFDWRHPGKRHDDCDRDTPIGFRWRFRDDRLIAFIAYGWCPDEPKRGRYGRIVSRDGSYGPMSAEARDEAAARLLARSVAA